MPLTPKQLFRKLYPDDVKALERVVNEGWFQRAVVHVQADISSRGWSPEKTSGATEFMNLLNDFAEEDAQPGQFPDKGLKTMDVKPAGVVIKELTK